MDISEDPKYTSVIFCDPLFLKTNIFYPLNISYIHVGIRG